MKIEIKEITNGGLTGSVLYVCDYRKPELYQKAARHVRPEKVLVADEKFFEDNGKKWPTVYYSTTVLLPLNKKDEPIFSRPIKVFDNTGFRAFTGIPLNAFDNWDECVEHYNQQLKTVIDEYTVAILNAPLALISEQEEIKKNIIRK